MCVVLYVFIVVDMVGVSLQVQFRTHVLRWLPESNRFLSAVVVAVTGVTLVGAVVVAFAAAWFRKS